MLQPAIVNFSAIRGLSFARTVELTRRSDGTPIDLGADDLILRVRAAPGVMPALLELSRANGRLATPAPGVVAIDVPATAMLGLPDVSRTATYVHSLIAINDAEMTQIWSGTFTVVVDVTQPWSAR